MAKRRRKVKELDTIWEVPDSLWERIQPILDEMYPPKPTGRPRADFRQVLDGIIFRMRTGCQWNKLPKQFGDDSTVHRWFQKWNQDGVMERIWSVLVAEYDELDGVEWKWQSADGVMGKARFGGARPDATPRIAGNRAPNAACSSMSTVARSAP